MAQRSMPSALKLAFRTKLGKVMQDGNVWLYKKTGGKLGGRMSGAPLLLLTTRGKKTGKQRTTPLIFLREAQSDTLAIVASKGGWPNHPLWYNNLQAEPSVQVQVGAQERPMTARTAAPEERARLWQELVRLYPPYADYQSWSDREIPVVVLSPR